MENLNTKILNKGEKKMSNKTQVWVIDWIETETNKIDVSAKEEKKENVSKVVISKVLKTRLNFQWSH